MSEAFFTIGGKKLFYKLQGDSLVWGKNKNLKKAEGECALKPGNTLSASGAVLTFGPDSKGHLIEATLESEAKAQELLALLAPYTEGEEEVDEDVLHQGWAVREKKRYLFQVTPGYLTWFHKEPSASISHNKNFVKELTLNACEVSASGNVVDLVKTDDVKGKKVAKSYKLEVEGDAGQWVTAIKDSIAVANEEGLGTPTGGKRAGLGARMKKGLAQKVATSKAGKGAAKKALPQEIMGLLAAIKTTFASYAGEARAVELENNMIRIIAKLFFAVDNKQVKIQKLLPADKYLRDALKWLSLVWGQRYRSILVKSQSPKEKEALNKVSADFKEVEKVLVSNLAGVLQPKNIQLIKSTLKFLTDHKYLTHVTEAEELEEARGDLELAMDAYVSVSLDPSLWEEKD